MSTNDPMLPAPEHMPTSLTHHLGREERLLWSGKPGRGIILHGSDAFAIPFGLLWTGFMIYAQHETVVTRAPVFVEIWVVPFIVLGLYISGGRLFFDWWQRSRTEYGITNERVIIVTKGLGGALRSLSLWSLGDLTIEANTDGRGTIKLGASWYEGEGRRKHLKEPPTLEGIPNAPRVYRIIREAQRADVSKMIQSSSTPRDDN